ncbi:MULTISPECIES: YesL family protein [Caproicibacterium]|jgi:uncharacterized membrane protein YesL|uniref:DUF624 domain-containing protein n=1 Tax=Caproicibacterium lactatifermentans TaxID=2666138 RepID=A0A859DNH7_9FIRM|nr:YesL family protein [Caproicibacterium lactatifermentans]ARP49471.1 hypothetical protein B6259_00330 [Ruminococcaceae bacterium CPB6]MDD4808038.1 YesL family protein [Oscillospiraceae bacterium]QKN23064.1 DUF624 domain-containing protein [Caproicibacterium lactatifermentans]QKO30330.1 DUF624 domain-containing protein [Caproicibacterium lactatifermentans]
MNNMNQMTATNDPDNLWKLGDSLTEICLIGALWFLCTIPIVTAGAATTAMYSVLFRKMKKDGRYQGYVKPFFAAFKENFRKSTGLWITELAVSLVLSMDAWYYSRLAVRAGTYRGLEIAILCLLAVVIIVGCYAFPMTALYRNTVKETILQAAQHALRSWPWSLLCLALCVGVPFVVTKGLWYLALIAGGVVGFAIAHIMVHALKKEIPRVHGPEKIC